MFSYILICIAMVSWTLSLFMAGPKSKLNPTRFVQKRCTYLAEIAKENNRTTSFGEKGSFICRHISLGKQLLAQKATVVKTEVLQNNEMPSPWSKHCWMLVASRNTTIR